jgi:hypothetical protein
LFLKTQIFCHPRAAHCPNAGWTASSNSPAAQPSWSSLAVVPITPNPQVNNRCPLARTTVFVWWWVRTWVQFPANKYLLTPVKPLRKVAERYLQLPPISRQPQLSATFRSFLSVKRRISTHPRHPLPQDRRPEAASRACRRAPCAAPRPSQRFRRQQSSRVRHGARLGSYGLTLSTAWRRRHHLRGHSIERETAQRLVAERR